MIKTILILAGGGATDTRVFDAALAVSRPLRAHLKFLTGLAPAARDHVAEFCAANEIALRATPGPVDSITAEILEETNDVEARLLEHARHSDLLVLGRASGPDLMHYDFIEKLLIGSGRPILIAPNLTPAQPSGTVVVAWQETPAAARALSAALPLLKHARRIVLLNVGAAGGDAQRHLGQVATQLSWHGILAESRFMAGNKSSPQILLEAAADLNPQLLVVGGYSQRPIHQSLFGGVTASLLAQSEAPIFMMH